MTKAEKKREELIAAFDRGEVRGPLVALVIPALVSIGVSYGLGLIVRALTPKPPIPEQGRMTGELTITRSAQGEFITEVFGGNTVDGLWVATTPYAQYSTVSVAGRWYMAETGGTSAGSQPTWPTTRGSTVADNTVVWRDMGKTGYGVRVAPIIIYTSGIRKHENITRQPTGGGKGFGGGGGNQTQEVREITYDIDAGMMWGRGPLSVLKEWAYAEVIRNMIAGSGRGIIDDDVDPDDDYPQEELPNPLLVYDRPVERHGGDLDFDAQGVGSGVMTVGGYSNVWDYPGNETQLPDPTIEAATDAAHGSGSTPAYRKRAYTLHKAFSLSRWGGTFPQLSALVANQTYKKLNQVCDQWCERAGLEASDYDCTALSPVRSRGIVVAGGKYAPADVMETCAHVYGAVYSKDIYFYESDKIYGVFGDATPVVTIPDTEIGWIDDEHPDGGALVEIESDFPPETELARRVALKFIDPEKDFEINEQSSARQITAGAHEKTSEVNITLTDEEARSVTDRDLYREHLRKPRRFTLSWTYVWLDPGTIIYVTRDEGINLTLQLESITGGVGVLECEAYDVDSAVITQSARTSGGAQFETPPVPIPAMTVAVLLDLPLLRDLDATHNNGVGFYWGATPRTSDDQVWEGASLWVNRVGWEKVAETTKRATIGKVAVVSWASPTDSTVFDYSSYFDVDLYGTTDSLTSATEIDVLNGANAAVSGSKVLQFQSAVRRPTGEGPNRWRLSSILWARRGTSFTAPEVGERFALLNEAIQFTPILVSELNRERDYKVVTAGQSLDDAAITTFAWEGGSVKPLAPVHVRGTRDTAGNLLIEWVRQGRVGELVRDYADVPIGEEVESYIVEVYSGATLKRTMPVPVYASLPAILRGSPAAGVSGNDVLEPSAGNSHHAYAEQAITGPGAFVEATLATTASPGGSAQMGFVTLTYAETFLPLNDERHYNVLLTDSTGTVTLSVTENGVQVYASSTIVGAATTRRVRAVFSGTEVRFYLDYRGPGSIPFYVSPVAPRFPYKPYFIASPKGKVDDIFVGGRPQPTTVYSAAQQTTDFGSTQSSVKVRVMQTSATVGRGFYTEVTI